MPAIKETTVYSLDELDERAKEKAREWYREVALDYDWWDCVVEDAAGIAELFGLDIRQTRKQRADGTPVYRPTVYFRGFCSQGDGACFEGAYQYKPGALAAVKAHAPEDRELHRIVAALRDVQRRNFYALRASASHRGHYYHAHCMRVSVEDTRHNYGWCKDEAEKEIAGALRDFADWIYSNLEREYAWLTSDEQIDEAIRANEYQFTEEGAIF